MRRRISFVAAGLAIVSCSARSTTESGSSRIATESTVAISADAPAARAHVERARAAVGTVSSLRGSEGAELVASNAKHVRVVVSGGALASVELPTSARGGFVVSDTASGTTVSATLRGASDAPLRFADGIGVYANAWNGADVFHVPSAAGLEDSLFFRTRPPVESITYDVDVSRAAGLRAVASTVELLDRSGAPRLRIAAPFVVDSAGRRSAARISIGGCAYDTDPRAPWGRPVVPPGSTSCQIAISWHSASYPLLVDPKWDATGVMAEARSDHTATLLGTGKVLVVGGGGATTSAELFDETTRTFAATGSLHVNRSLHSANLLGTGKVLVAGGTDGSGLVGAAELYDASAGTFSDTGTMVTARAYNSSTRLASGKVLFAGGTSTIVNVITAIKSAELYDPGTGAFTTTGAMTEARYLFASALLPSGKVLVAGGNTAAGDTDHAELYDPTAATFARTTNDMIASTESGPAVTLTTGNVLVVDGTFAKRTFLFSSSAGTFSSGPAVSVFRSGAVALPMPGGDALIAGGQDVASEIFHSSTTSISTTAALPAKVQRPAACLLASGTYFVCGGYADAGPVPTAEVWTDLANGGACTDSAECTSGFCVDGVCCDSACGLACQACDVSGHVGACSTVTGPPHGATRQATCGGAGACAGVCDGTRTNECSYPTSLCGSTCADGSETDSVCDGAGKCVVSSPHTCNNLTCEDASKCRVTCTADSDCLNGLACRSDGTCGSASVCSDAHTSRAADGTSTDCGAYVCGTDGRCKDRCASIDDCSAPNVCDSSGKCVASSGSGDGGCSSSAASPAGAGAWMWLGLALFVVRRRSRRPS